MLIHYTPLESPAGQLVMHPKQLNYVLIICHLVVGVSEYKLVPILCNNLSLNIDKLQSPYARL
jgi:hypothetical protein